MPGFEIHPELVVHTNRGILVVLSDADVALGLMVAAKYEAQQGVGVNYRQAEFSDRESRNTWIKGILGEVAAAGGLGIEWSGDIGTDVGPYQIKAVTERHHRLFIPSKGRHREPDKIYISVLYDGTRRYGAEGTLKGPWLLRGWATAGEIIQPEHLDTLNNEQRQPAYALPNKLLKPMEDLCEISQD